MREDLTGRRFGRLVVEGPAPDKVLKSGYHEPMWICVCDCGKRKVIRGKSLRGGITSSCGCWQRESVGNRARTHGGFGTRLYAVWDSMRQRCLNPAHHAYENYGGRGIRICPEWDDFAVFRTWALAAGYDEYAERGTLTLDRIDVEQGYSPDNCRWSNMREQANNRRMSIRLDYLGESRTLTEWAALIGLDYTTLWKRYNAGKSPEEILKH